MFCAVTHIEKDQYTLIEQSTLLAFTIAAYSYGQNP